MRPRGDVDVADNPDVENSNVILRRSITFGPEITKDEEKMQDQKKPKRGLYFMCYQADLRNGFNLLTTRMSSPILHPNKRCQLIMILLSLRLGKQQSLFCKGCRTSSRCRSYR